MGTGDKATRTITDFHFTVYNPGGSSDPDFFLVNATSQSTSGLTAETRFEVESPSQLWTRVISADQKSVDFFAPAGFELTPGVTFFVNINLITGGGTPGLSDFAFNASYTESVPRTHHHAPSWNWVARSMGIQKEG